jgi:MarR family transcriptional regulator, organic hydroperoxide resistance regulator
VTNSTRRKMLQVLQQFRVVFKSIRRHYQEVERRAGMSGAQLWALAEVAKHPGRKVGELARALAIHQSTASNLVRRLEGLGMLIRQRRGRDQRHVQLFASGKGLRLLRRAPRPFIGVLQQALCELSASRLERLHAELSRVIAVMKGKTLAARTTLLSEM